MSRIPGSNQAARRQALGFRDGNKGTHSARTLMLSELRLLLDHTAPDASPEDYQRLIVDENILAKPTLVTRKRTYRIIKPLYGLDDAIPIFRTLVSTWAVDPASQPLLAFLTGYARDPLLRAATPAILELASDEPAERAAIESLISQKFPDRFSENTQRSMAGNILSTFTQSGHLKGHSKKHRAQAQATPLSAAFAFYLAYLEGFRAGRILTSIWARLLDTPADELMALAREAGRLGWLNFRQAGDVLELRFPDWISAEEEELTHE